MEEELIEEQLPIRGKGSVIQGVGKDTTEQFYNRIYMLSEKIQTEIEARKSRQESHEFNCNLANSSLHLAVIDGKTDSSSNSTVVDGEGGSLNGGNFQSGESTTIKGEEVDILQSDTEKSPHRSTGKVKLSPSTPNNEPVDNSVSLDSSLPHHSLNTSSNSNSYSLNSKVKLSPGNEATSKPLDSCSPHHPSPTPSSVLSSGSAASQFEDPKTQRAYEKMLRLDKKLENVIRREKEVKKQRELLEKKMDRESGHCYQISNSLVPVQYGM